MNLCSPPYLWGRFQGAERMAFTIHKINTRLCQYFLHTPQKLNIVFAYWLAQYIVLHFARKWVLRNFPLGIGQWPVCGAIHLRTLSGLYVFVSSIAVPWEPAAAGFFILRGTAPYCGNDESLLSGKHTGFYQDRCSRFFCAQTPKGFEDISSRKVETRNEIQTKMETRRSSAVLASAVPQVQKKAAFE